MTIQPNEKAKISGPATVKVYEFLWLMTTPMAFFGGFFIIGHISLTLYLLKNLEESYSRVPDGYKRYLTYLKFAFFCLLHNADLASDILYVKTVPTYNRVI